MNLDPFEQQLRRQPLRTVPEAWRDEILATARLACARTADSAAPVAPAEPWWRAWLWPHPAAWAALAGVWAVVIGLHWDAPPNPSTVTRRTAASPDAIRFYAEQHRELGQILGSLTGSKPKPAGLRPRSQRKNVPVFFC
jgi:hypothetical protein